MVKIFDRKIPGLPIINWARGKPICIVAHDVANMNSTIEGEINYMKNNWQNAFYQVLVGTEGAYVLHDIDKSGAWGAGPSMHAYAIHIELKNYKTKAEFDKSYKNYVATIQYYAKKYNIPLKLNTGTDKRGIYTHHYVTRTFGGTSHTDPDAYFQRYGKTITQFGKDLKNASLQSTSKWTNKKGNWTGSTLKRHDKGKQVKQLQQKLYNAYPRYLKKNQITGKYTKATQNAVKRFKKDNNMKNRDDVARSGVYKKLKKVLTVSEKQELNELRKEVKSLKKLVNNKADKPYTSDTPDDAHKDNVNWAKNHKIMDESNPYEATKRQQTASIIKNFNDFKFPVGGDPDSVHEEAYKWLKEMGITNSDNPHMPITYEQFATMLKRYDDIKFPQDGDVDSTHEEAFKRIKELGITDGSNPNAPITKAQFATMLLNYNERDKEDKEDKENDKENKDKESKKDKE